MNQKVKLTEDQIKLLQTGCVVNNSWKEVFHMPYAFVRERNNDEIGWGSEFEMVPINQVPPLTKIALGADANFEAEMAIDILKELCHYRKEQMDSPVIAIDTILPMREVWVKAFAYLESLKPVKDGTE